MLSIHQIRKNNTVFIGSHLNGSTINAPTPSAKVPPKICMNSEIEVLYLSDGFLVKVPVELETEQPMTMEVDNDKSL